MKVFLFGVALSAAGILPAATGCAEFRVEKPRGGMLPVVRAADFGFSVTNDFNAAAINRAMEHCRKIKARTLELEPGVYNCFDSEGGVVIADMTDFTFDGRGAELVFRRPARFRCQPQSELIHENANMLVKNCERVKIFDFKMDWDWERDPLAAFGECTRVHVDEKNDNSSFIEFLFTDFKRHPRYPEPVPVQTLRTMDRNRESFAAGVHFHFGLSEGHWGSKSEWIAPNKLRIWPGVKAPGRDYNPTYDFWLTKEKNLEYVKKMKVGGFYRLQHYYYGKNGINMVSNRHLTLQEVDIFSSFGMGIVVDGRQKYWHVENVRIMPRPGAKVKRPMSSSSDAYHVARSCGYARHVNLQVKLNNDDALNLHDRFVLATKSSARTLEVASDRGIGYFRPEPGDPFELRRPDWSPTGFKAVFVRSEGNTMFLDRDIPEDIGENFFVFDRAYGTDNVIFRNCLFEDTAHRNLFSPSNMTIEDCVFRRNGSRAVWILADARKKTWCEGMGATNIVVRNNLFEDCSCNRPSQPVIAVSLVNQTPWKKGEPYHDFIKDILIEDNVIVDPHGPALRLESGRDIVFRGNEIRFSRPPVRADAGAMENRIGARARIEQNSYITNPPPKKISYKSFPEAEITVLGSYRVQAGKKYVAESGYVAESFTPGAMVDLQVVELDAEGRELAKHGNISFRAVQAAGFVHRLYVPFTAHARAEKARVEMVVAGNPVELMPLSAYVKAASKAPLYAGIYDKEDPMPPDRAATLREMAKTPPATARIERRRGRNVVMIDGRPTALNQYKGFTDYRLMGECGGNIVITFNRGMRLFRDATFDEAVRDEKTGKFDFTALEDTLCRIYAANPKARVFVSVDLDPDKEFLERNQDAIFINENGVRARANFGAFGGYDSTPLDPSNKRVNWAYAYTSEAWQEYVDDGLRRLCAFLKSTPAGNIVAGFHISGGMDGQFVQWEYGPQNGHFDYSEANRRALCRYLKELYGTDEKLREAWGDDTVTLDTARNPSVAEFKSAQAFDDRPGFGRRLADCRRFVSVGPARALARFARTLKSAFARECLVETWYTSTIWSQAGRLAVDELVKDGGVDIICTVSGYSNLRAANGPGGAADNSIAAINLRGCVYVQEMDHRTWRTQHTGGWVTESAAIPENADVFANQIRRDAASVIAAGGVGFHLFDMYGSWYHGSKVKPAIREIFALNDFATRHAGEYPLARMAIFADEKARLLRENTYDAVNNIWRTSGVTPAIHYLADIENPNLPDYDLMVVWSPITITAAQTEAFRRRAERKGKVLAIIGEAGCGSRDYRNTAEVLAAFGMKARHTFASNAETVVRAEGVEDPLLAGWKGMSDAFGMDVRRGKLIRRYQIGYATVDDPGAKTLGVWEKRGGAAFSRKPLGHGTLVYMAREGGLTPSLLNSLARSAGIQPFAAPGNATYVGNGVAAVHRLDAPARVEFPGKVMLVDPVSGRERGPVRFWEPEIKPGECAATAYREVK